MKSVLVLSALIALCACATLGETARAAVPVEQAAPVAVTPLVAGGPAVTPPEYRYASNLAGAIDSLDYLTNQGGKGVKLLGLASRDVHVNGLRTYIAVYVSMGEGWRAFPVGDFLDYRILSDSPGRIDLEVDHSVWDEAIGDFVTGTRRIIVGWTLTASDDGRDDPTVTVTITPAVGAVDAPAAS
jgi:hypothetical protein